MPDKKPNTPEELNELLHSERMGAFSFFRQISRLSPDGLKAFGYQNMTNAEALLAAFKARDKKVEQMIVDFERRHPR